MPPPAILTSTAALPRNRNAPATRLISRAKTVFEGLPPPDAFAAQLIRHLIAGDISPAQYITLIRLHSPS